MFIRKSRVTQTAFGDGTITLSYEGGGETTFQDTSDIRRYLSFITEKDIFLLEMDGELIPIQNDLYDQTLLFDFCYELDELYRKEPDMAVQDRAIAALVKA